MIFTRTAWSDLRNECIYSDFQRAVVAQGVAFGSSSFATPVIEVVIFIIATAYLNKYVLSEPMIIFSGLACSRATAMPINKASTRTH